MVLPEFDNPVIVLLGSFNPAIFQPLWLAQNGLLREEEAKAAEVRVISPEVTVFSTPWMGVEVTSNRFAARANDGGHALPLRDLVIGTFRLLEHTPITAMGLNRLSHYKMPNREQWDKVGDTLAPKEHWSQILAGKVGMRSLTVEAQRPESSAKFVRVKVEPSLKVEFGLFIEVNEHFVVDTEEAKDGLVAVVKSTAVAATNLIRDQWESNQGFALKVMQHILSLVPR